jgi:Putative zinc-finger
VAETVEPHNDHEFRTFDAAYVLGALAPQERHAYEQHLAGCPRCRDAVRELAGLPGLLSRVRMEEFGSPAEDPPPDLLPGLLAAADRRRRRSRWYVIAGGAVAAAACLVLALLLAIGPGGGSPRGEPMAQVVPAPVHATVSLRAQPWGTDVSLRCHYDESAAYKHGYALVVVDRSGRVEQISTWQALPGTTAVLTGTTSLLRDQISAVQVRTTSGAPILTMRP